MSISMESFSSTGQFLTWDPFAAAPTRVTIFQVQCRCCGYEPPREAVIAPRVCPKCRGESWERFARPGSILENADRYPA